jgi:hypothetical protein
MAKLIGDTDLRVLKLFWLGIVSLLPGELLGETVSQPDVEKDDVVSAPDVHLAACKQLLYFVVSMHEGPSVVLALTF